MAGRVVGRHRGSGEDELTREAAIIHGPPDMIPDRRLELPLVDQPRHPAREDTPGLEAGQAQRHTVDIEPHLTGGDLLRRGGLAASPRALDHDRSGGLQALRQLAVDDSGMIGHAVHRADLAGGPS